MPSPRIHIDETTTESRSIDPKPVRFEKGSERPTFTICRWDDPFLCIRWCGTGDPAERCLNGNTVMVVLDVVEVAEAPTVVAEAMVAG